MPGGTKKKKNNNIINNIKTDPYKEILEKFKALKNTAEQEQEKLKANQVSIYNVTEETLETMSEKQNIEFWSRKNEFYTAQVSLSTEIGNSFKVSNLSQSSILKDNELNQNFLDVLKLYSELAHTDKYSKIFPDTIDIMKNEGLNKTNEDNILFIRQQFISHCYDQISGHKISVNTLDNLLSALDERLIDSNLLSREKHTATMLSLMAADPAYNDLIYDKIKDVISHNFQNCDDQLKKLGITIDMNDPENAAKVRGSVYQLYYTSAQFKEYHLNNDGSFKSKVKGNVLPHAFDVQTDHWKEYCKEETGYKLFKKDQERINDYMKNLAAAATNKKLAEISPERFVQGIAQYEEKHHLLANRHNAKAPNQANQEKSVLDEMTFDAQKNNLLADIDSAFFDELAHNTGNFKTSNSKSYNAMGEALSEIRKKLANMEQPDNNDYEQLFNRCVEYIMQHDSVPTSRSGKKRFQAASVIAGVLAAKLGKSAFTKDEDGSDYAKTGMLRSKAFRDAYTKTLQNEAAKHFKISNRIDNNDQNLNDVWKIRENMILCDKLGDIAMNNPDCNKKNIKNDGTASEYQLKETASYFSALTEEDQNVPSKRNPDSMDYAEQNYGNGKTPAFILNAWYTKDLRERFMPEPLGKVRTR